MSKVSVREYAVLYLGGVKDSSQAASAGGNVIAPPPTSTPSGILVPPPIFIPGRDGDDGESWMIPGPAGAAGGGGGGSLTVEEVDGSPTDSAVTKIVFPNGTLGIASHVATYTPAGGGGGGAMTLIQEIVLGADATDITFTGIPGTFKDLFASYVVRSTAGAVDNIYYQVGNGSIDTGAHYTSFAPYAGTGSGTVNSTGSSSAFLGIIASAADNAGYFASGDVTFQDYTSTSKTRNFRGNSGWYDNGVAAYFVYDSWATWTNTTQAIDTIKFLPLTGPNFKAGSKIALYGRG